MFLYWNIYKSLYYIRQYQYFLKYYVLLSVLLNAKHTIGNTVYDAARTKHWNFELLSLLKQIVASDILLSQSAASFEPYPGHYYVRISAPN